MRNRFVGGAILLLLPVSLLAASRAAAAAPDAAQPVAVLQLKVVEGDGAVHRAGFRSTTPLTIQVTDETGRPVRDAIVSLMLPGRGATGVFASGLSTEVLTTGGDGKATAEGIRWGRTTGSVAIRITAVKGDIRAGAMATVYLAEAEEAAKSPSDPASRSVSKPRGKWIALAVIAAGAAAGGLALGLTGQNAMAAPGPSPPAGSQLPTVQIGPPAISVGAP